MFKKEIYVKRRNELKKKVGGGLLLFLGNGDVGMNFADNCYDFRQDSTMLYFFGSDNAGVNAVIDIDNDKEIIFEDELTVEDIVWMGILPSVGDKAAMAGISDTRPAKDFAKYISNAVKSKQKIHFLPPYRSEHQLKLKSLLGIEPENQKAEASVDFIMGVADLRNHKSAEEIVEIEKAVDISADMHIAAIKMARPGLYEYQIAAKILEIAKANNGALSFPTICTVHGQTLHNHYHGNKLEAGQMLLIDAGAENDMHYAGDISSTCPVNERFTDRQRMILDMQVKSHMTAVNALKPGIKFWDVYIKACESIAEDMKSLGLMKGDVKEAVIAGAHALFFPCGLGHMMGLDVHDMESLGEQYVGYGGKPKSTLFGYKSLRLGRELEEGFVLTIEPGIYFIPELIDQWKAEKHLAQFFNFDEIEKWKGFSGLRNEEDYLVTPYGSRRLGKYVPLRPDEIEALKASAD